ncbi:hypothetical protein BVX98_07465 [bacterium F11]|nr:hypothetical protein BVX98_07465 [bacterium F11]
MLRSFKEHLKKLSREDMDDFSKRILVRTQFRVKDEEAKKYPQALKSLILVMPDLINQVQTLSHDRKIPHQEKQLIGYLLTLIHQPHEITPYRSFGMFGYLEDAYLTGKVYSRILRFLDEGGNSNHLELGDLPRDVSTWLNMAKKVVPSEAQKVDRMLEELVADRLDTFQRVMEERIREAQHINDEETKKSVFSFPLGMEQVPQGLEGQYAMN